MTNLVLEELPILDMQDNWYRNFRQLLHLKRFGE